MYKYMGVDIVTGLDNGNDVTDEYSKTPIWDIKMRRILKVCNPPSQMAIGTEGLGDLNHTLEGIVIFLRRKYKNREQNSQEFFRLI